jgi:hypothetical protein
VWGAWLGGVAIGFVVAEVQLWQRQQQQKQGEDGEEKEEGDEDPKAAGMDNPMHRDD